MIGFPCSVFLVLCLVVAGLECIRARLISIYYTTMDYVKKAIWGPDPKEQVCDHSSSTCSTNSRCGK